MNELEELNSAAVMPTTTPKPTRQLELDDSMLKKVTVVLKYILKFEHEVDLYPHKALIRIKKPEHLSDEEAFKQLTVRLGQACPGVEVEQKDECFWIILAC